MCWSRDEGFRTWRSYRLSIWQYISLSIRLEQFFQFKSQPSSLYRSWDIHSSIGFDGVCWRIQYNKRQRPRDAGTMDWPKKDGIHSTGLDC